MPAGFIINPGGVDEVAYVKICDLCKRPIESEQKRKRYKIKEYKEFWDYSDGLWHAWCELDAHEECVERLFNACKETSAPSGGSAMQDE